MITVAVLAILLSLAAPSFRTLMLNNRLSARVDGLYNALNYARNTALSSNVGTLVCPLSAVNSTACGTDWSAGWIVKSTPTATPSTLLQSSSAAANGPVLSAVVSSGTPPLSVAFDSRGLAGSAANFKLCDSRGAASAKSLQVLATGFVQVGPTAGLAAWDGSSLSCP